MSVVAGRMLRIGFGMIAWAAVLAATLSIAALPGNWGHAICGAWGCGPPLQALVACHLAWLVVLAPPAAMLSRSGLVAARARRQFGILLSITAVLFLAGVVIGQLTTWWPAASEWQRGFFWQRCGFIVATMVDIPVAQVLLMGLYLTLSRRGPV